METQQSPLCENTTINGYSGVDTSRPFSSVKEAVAVFGERLLASNIYSTISKQQTVQKPLPPLSPPSLSNHNQVRDEKLGLMNSLKKLETELEETKRELKLLKERESETEIALASLNAELHKNISKIAEAEAGAGAGAAAAKVVATRDLINEGEHKEDGICEEEKITDDHSVVRMEYSPCLAQLLSLGEMEGYFEGKKKQRKIMKKKPIIPLVGDMFSRKKGSSKTLHKPRYTSSNM